MNENFNKAVKDFMKVKGSKINYTNFYGTPEVDVYGWCDYNALDHIKGRRDGVKCEWVIPEEAEVHEVNADQFMDTFSGNKESVLLVYKGVECKCGKFKNVDIGWEGTMLEAMENLF